MKQILCTILLTSLLMAGRNISTTQSGLGAARVKRTTGMQGEIVGKAAAVCIQHNALPRDIYKVHLGKLKELMK